MHGVVSGPMLGLAQATLANSAAAWAPAVASFLAKGDTVLLYYTMAWHGMLADGWL